MYQFVNKDNLYHESFEGCENLIDPSQIVPSLSELVQQARQTGQMPYGSQRVPVPSYTDDIDSDIPFNSFDCVAAYLNEQSMRQNIVDTESKLSDIQKRIEDSKAEKPKNDKQPLNDPSPAPAPAGD